MPRTFTITLKGTAAQALESLLEYELAHPRPTRETRVGRPHAVISFRDILAQLHQQGLSE